jgi:hypothetical protein
MCFKVKLVIVLLICVIFAGCLMGKKEAPPTPPKVYVTPCNVAGKGVQVRVSGDLNTNTVKPELEQAFVDDFKSPAATEMRATYTLNCYWGQKVGERRDYYYCAGKYKAPELDEERVIRRFVWKDFKIGFSEEHTNVGSWVDHLGKVHNEGTIYYLTIKTVEATCYVA